MHRPRLLFLDEPTTGLDPQSRAALWDEVRRLADDGVTVFLTTQYLEEADVLADRVGIIDHGKIVAEGTPTELKAEIGRPSVEAVPADPGDRERLAAVLHRFGEEAAAAPNGVAAQLPEGVSDLAEIVRTLDAEGLRDRRPAPALADARRRVPREDRPLARGRGRRTTGTATVSSDGDGPKARDAGERGAGRLMSSVLATQVGVLARRSMLKTLRQPFQLFPIIFFPLILLAVNASGLKAATRLPGFPTHSYISFAIAVAFIQGGDVLADQHGHEPRRGHRERLLQPPRADAAAAGVADRGPARRRGGARGAAVGRVHPDGPDRRAPTWTPASAARWWSIVLGSLTALAFGALGCAAALRTGSGEAVQGLFPLFFVFIFLSSSNLPRNLLGTGWFHTVANWNPISYLIEAFRSLYIYGWDATALWRGFAVAIGPDADRAAGAWRARCGRGCSGHEHRVHIQRDARLDARRRASWRRGVARSPGGACTPTSAGPTCSSPR